MRFCFLMFTLRYADGARYFAEMLPLSPLMLIDYWHADAPLSICRHAAI